MSAVKAPAEIARCTFEKLYSANTKACEADVLQMLESAIAADRAQRDPDDDGTIHGAAIMALKERAENADDGEGYDDSGRAMRAAEWIDENPDDFWVEFAGPMLDEIEQEHGA